MGILDGVVVPRRGIDDKPAGMSERDLHVRGLGRDRLRDRLRRDRYCARVPMNRSEMATIVDYLNGLNEPYRTGAEGVRVGRAPQQLRAYRP